MDGQSQAAVREGGTWDKAGPSRPKRAKPTPQESGETCLDDRALNEVAWRLGCDWPTLAVAQLRFTDTEVKIIEEDYQNDTIRQGLEMLVKWKQRQSTSDEQQMTTLCTALKNARRADIAEFLRHDTSHAQETAESGPDHLKILQQLLVSYYEAHAGFIPELVTSSMSPALDVDKFCVPLDLHKSEKHTTSKDVKISGKTKSLNRPKTVPLDTWEDMYDKKKVKEKMVLLSGGAGFGKSTLCVTIANTWKNREGSKVAEFELLFLLKLSQFKTSCVIDAIFDQLLQHTDKLTKSDVKKVISDNEDKVAFLMDGLDEISGNILESADDMYTINDLLENKVLLNSCVLVTTRPDMAPKVIKGYRGYATVETKGFAFENRDTFIIKHFADNITSGKDLISWLKSNQSLQELSKNPIIVQMLCLLWLNRTDQSKQLPNKFTTVFTEFADLLFERRFSSLSGADRQQEMDKLLSGLGQVALEGLVSGEIVNFSPEDFSRDASILKDGCQMGILQTETASSGCKGHGVEVITFFHKSHQEYCAAHYLISLLYSDEQSFCQYIDKVIAFGVMKIEFVLRFCCGLSEQAADLILNRIGHGYDSLARVCLFESGSKSLALKLPKPDKISCEGQENLVALRYYLESGVRLKRTAFEITCDAYADLQVLGDIFRRCKNDIRSMTIDCVLSHQGNAMLRLLAKKLQNAERALLIKKLIEIRVFIFDEDIHNYAKCLSKCISQLPYQSWNVTVSGESHNDVCVLVDSLKGCKLHCLRIFDVNMHRHVADLGPLVTPSLARLELDNCGLDDADVEGVASLLPGGHGLTVIDLEDNAFSLDAVKTLAGHLQDLSELTWLLFKTDGLDDNKVEKVLQEILPQLKENRKALGPFHCNSYEEVHQLTQALRSVVVHPTSWTKIHYTMSERWREELKLLEESFGSLDERLRGQMKLTVDVGVESGVNVEWLAGCISRLSSQVKRFNLHMTGRSPSYVTGLLNALTEECTLSGLKVDGTNMCMVM
ncbi:uncharacterized protein LOC119736837 [Patiria miniata]|uniref:Uncharacterized protein n=1 Tax=Patiria miniata TaxID=46514 RepID=A0A914ATG4_PATMI|nr:uncharacterized protein LOC119736837 [Patiria miniata]